MPQINRIRVNNVKYNFGTQFYDDFLMRFSCKNTIYDLANGGGKSVLMLLLLQTIIPNCTLDEKQPVEKLFRTAAGSTTIHSLVEWKLDACDVFEGFRYMTCGFCARKGRDNGDGDEGVQTGIDYFNYCIFYREFGENDIKNLPLSSNGERITYNGLKSYLRELERRDPGVRVKIFEGKGEYQAFINDYGIYESQWELIRGINKTEGHVRTYFENSYRTTRKVVEDLLIEEIIEKSYNNRIRGDGADDEMADTLLSIKDKLLELAKRKEHMEDYRKQRELLNDFAKRVETFKELYVRKDESRQAVYNRLLGIKEALLYLQDLNDSLDERHSGLIAEQTEEERLVALGRLEEEKRELDKLKSLADELLHKEEQLKKGVDLKERQIVAAQTALDLEDYKEQEKTLLELEEYIKNRHKDRGDILGELKMLAASKHKNHEKLAKEYEERVLTYTSQLGELREKLQKGSEKLAFFKDQALKSSGALEGLKKEEEMLSSSANNLIKDMGILVYDDTDSLIDEKESALGRLKKEKESLSGELAELSDKQEYCVKERAGVEAELIVVSGRWDALKEAVRSGEDAAREFESLEKIYGEHGALRLSAAIGKVYAEMDSRHAGLLRQLETAKNKLEMVGRCEPAQIPEYDELISYLEGRYPDKVRSAKGMLMGLDTDKKEELILKYPFFPYGIVCEDYNTIISDKNIRLIDAGGIIPIFDAEKLDGIGAEFDGVSFVCGDFSYVYDENGRNLMTKKLNEEIEHLTVDTEKLAGRLSVVGEDKIRVSTIEAVLSEYDGKKKELDEARKDYERLEKRKESLTSLKEDISMRIETVRGRLKSVEDAVEEASRECERLNAVKSYTDNLKLCLQRRKEQERLLEEGKKGVREWEDYIAHYDAKASESETVIRNANQRLAEINSRWENDYARYFDGSVSAVDTLSDEDIDYRFDALVKLLRDDMGDLADKEVLIANCRKNMEKISHSMEYRGISFAQAQQLADAGELPMLSHEQIIRIGDESAKLKNELRGILDEVDSVQAQLNRLEGSLEHGRSMVEERYGRVDDIETDSPAAYIENHKKRLEHIRNSVKELADEKKKSVSVTTEYMVVEKDLSRMATTLGIECDIEVTNKRKPGDDENKDYERICRDFEKLLAEESKKKQAFYKEKDVLVGTLAGLKAYELSEELKSALVAPCDLASAEELITGLNDTAECILLEESRIGKGIEDMELIKDNFENRCLQICSNIKSQLERLPKLSKITLDDEVIPMLSLQIPYVKEEQYKERMSVYINETAAAAQTLETREERIKYIRSRLGWKRLFSVIVSDMNSIRLNLYKRERIKDQSRYLKYEEAVGSTGQSQGIYIQFLVAIINYIASINAAGKEASVLGKTIFIDNPFGAAKDIYIWEPIFGMLKTNHVQLIVPARGATPAITGRFDVNYVLGQKMTGGKQQTVVVDYRSQVKTEELEYEKLSFSQEVFDFL